RLYSALKWRITGRPTTSGSGQPPAPVFADPRSGVGEPPASPPLTNSSVFTHRTLPALSFALLIHPCQLSHFSLTQRAAALASPPSPCLHVLSTELCPKARVCGLRAE